MSEERGVGTAQPAKPFSTAFGLMAQSLELSARPPDDISIDPLQDRTQLRLIEVAVVDAKSEVSRCVSRRDFERGPRKSSA